jgi:hypothetical protein
MPTWVVLICNYEKYDQVSATCDPLMMSHIHIVMTVAAIEKFPLKSVDPVIDIYMSKCSYLNHSVDTTETEI